MSQVGHASSKTTLDVYAQLEQRVRREHGVRFDALVRGAKRSSLGAHVDPDWESSGSRAGDQGPGAPLADNPEKHQTAP
jgi:hypothetical protein